MKKLTLSAFVATLVFASAGFFLRLSQISLELLPDGFLKEGSFLHIPLFVLTAVLLVGLCLLLRPLEPRPRWRNVFSPAPLSNVLLLVASLGLLVGNLISLAVGSDLPVTAVSAPRMIETLNRLLAPLGLIAAGCVAAFAITCLFGRKPSPLFFMAVSIYLTVRLILNFQRWNTDPSIHVYFYQLLAAICVMLGSFQLAGFSFDKGKRSMTLFWCLNATFFCAVSGADCLRSGSTAELLVNFALLFMMAAASFQLLFCPACAPEEAHEPCENPDSVIE